MGEIQACRNVNLDFQQGTITAIAGENGAGKSTLMNILCGTVIPDKGSFSIDGEMIESGNPALSAQAGIGMIHQLPMRSSGLTVLENIILGAEPRKFRFFTDKKPADLQIKAIQKKYDLDLDLSLLCSDLNSVQIQNMELIYLLYTEKKVLIFDEPTASLSEEQTERFYKRLMLLKGEKKIIIFISHKLKEVLLMADRIVVMRKGQIVLNDIKGEIRPQILAEKMIGRKENLNSPLRVLNLPRSNSKKLFEIERVSYRKSESRYIEELSLFVREGEILGITGIRENGLEILEDLISGMIHPQKGRFFFNGKEISHTNPADLRKLGISYVPADRLNRGTSRDASIAENLILLNYRRLHKMGILAPSSIRRWALNVKNNYNIDGDLEQPVSNLSGGNIQKVILSRELEENPKLIIICEPSWGLDFNSRNKLHKELDKTANKGTAILLISSDIDEILSLSDRIAVIYSGKTALQGKRDEMNRKMIGRAMLGLEVE